MTTPAALVTGDIVLDSHLYGGVKTDATSHKEPGTEEATHLGGAELSRKTMAAAADAAGLAWDAAKKTWTDDNEKRMKLGDKPLLWPENLPEERSYTTHLSIDVTSLEDSLPGNLRSYGVWTPHPAKKGAKDDVPRVWRVQEDFGYGSSGGKGSLSGHVFSPAENLPTTPSLILVDDGGILFRHAAAQEIWPDFSKAASNPDPSLIVLKMAAPICRGDFWPHILAQPGVAERLLVIVSVEDLRREDAQIRKYHSWEQSATDALLTLYEHPTASRLREAAQIVVNFRSAGALWLHRDKPGAKHTVELIFDPVRLEGDFHRDFQGSVYGFQSCLAVSVAHHFMMGEIEKSRSKPRPGYNPIASGIISGLQARKRLLQLGHGQVGKGKPGFPITEIGKVIAGYQGGYVRVPMPDLDAPLSPCPWTILADSEQIDSSSSRSAPLIGLAQLTATYGPSALSLVPTLERGSLFTADRSEIESLRTLESLIREYEIVQPQKKPLSIGVFGPPGAGKSFGVKALAKAILGDKVPILEFNLSQFKDPGELIGALHRVRDEVLKGATPVAFWDEFDSQGYKWLQYLLAPMQDGAFQEGQITHPIGKCIFIFAGGTADSLGEFGVRVPGPLEPAQRQKLEGAAREDHIEAERTYRDFKLLKGPDFISRLHGYLNVLGPNPRKEDAVSNPDKAPNSVKCADRTWPIRRALMLRGVLGLDKSGASEKLDMDTGLLLALLGVSTYTHGSRSFEKILVTLQQGRQGSHFHRSALPPDSLLDRETDAQEFHKIMNQHNAFKTHPDLERLAAAIHENYLRNASAKGWSVKPEVNKPYEELAPDYQASNRAAAQRIPELLSLISFKVVINSAPNDDSWKKPLVEQIERHRDRLAQAEHLGWNAERTANGWTYASVRDDARKQHNLIVDWAALADYDKEKDRENMDAIPSWLELAGYKAEAVIRTRL